MDIFNYTKCFSDITGNKISAETAIIHCKTNEDYQSEVLKYGKELNIPENMLNGSLRASGTFLYSTNGGGQSAVIVNLHKLQGKGSYGVDKITFHELGHLITINKFKGISLKNTEQIFAAYVIKEAMACYYSYLCLSQVYDLYDENEDVKKETKEDFDYFFETMSGHISFDNYDGKEAEFLAPTDVGDIIGYISEEGYQYINTLSETEKSDFWEYCCQPRFSEKLYNISYELRKLLIQDHIDTATINSFLKEFKCVLK